MDRFTDCNRDVESVTEVRQCDGVNLTHTVHLRSLLQFAAASAVAGIPAAMAPPTPRPPSSLGLKRRFRQRAAATKSSAWTRSRSFRNSLGPDRRPRQTAIGVIEPNSFISAQTINNQMAPTADYATIANIAPSIVNVETGGPGLSESKMLSMRGFQDGQYNVTYDGIPFGDANGQTHHTTSYFPAKVLGGEVIDRGPGTAADIGENTFGGTIGLLSKDPRPDPATVLTLSPTGAGTRFSAMSRSTPAILPKFERRIDRHDLPVHELRHVQDLLLPSAEHLLPEIRAADRQEHHADHRRQLQQHQVQQPRHRHPGADQRLRPQLRAGRQSL